jgi:hypothetical protein
MGEVKRWYPDGNGDSAYMTDGAGQCLDSHDEPGGFARGSDYARLERERDHYKAFHDETMPVLEAAQGLRNRLESTERAMAAQAEELTRLRAVEKALRTDVERLSDYKQSMAEAIEEDRPEWKRLRDIEVAARDMLAKLDSEGYSGPYMRALADACGRKG